MSSEYLKRFENGFTLDEQSLRKLRDIISSRIKEKEIIFILKRLDGFSYQTSNVEELIEIESSSWINIKSIAITVGEESNENNVPVKRINLDFSKNEFFSIGLKVLGNDKDIVNLIGDDLNSYLNAKVLKKKSNVLSYMVILGISLMLLSIAIVITKSASIPESSELISQLQSMTDSQKLDYIITNMEGKDKPSSESVAFALMSILSLSTILIAVMYGDSLGKIKNKYFPRCSFLFGNELISYQRINSIKKNIFWCIIVASIVSFVTGLMVYYLTGN
ncbi:hypothetical protein ACQ676_001923 [Vibrio fluvialis]